MLDELMLEISRCEEYKKQNEYLKADKLKMSEKLYELMLEKYNNTPYEERARLFENESCKCCRNKYYCEIELNELPEDIMKPIPSCNGWIPTTTGCGGFEWD